MRTEEQINKAIDILMKRRLEAENLPYPKDDMKIPLALLDTQLYMLKWALGEKNVKIGWNFCTQCGILYQEKACPECKSDNFREKIQGWLCLTFHL